MTKSDWRKDISEFNFDPDVLSNNKVTINLRSKNKTDKQKKKPIQKIKAARDVDGDGKLEKKRIGGDFSETLLYDVVLDYIISENFASDTEGANKVMLKLSDELMQEIYERTMTSSEKRKDTMLKKKYDDSEKEYARSIW